MKTAIILHGNIRTWDETKHSFLESFEYLTPDIYISTYDRQWGYHPYVKNLLSYFDDNSMDEHEIRKIFSTLSNVVDIEIENADTVDENVKKIENEKFALSMKEITSCFSQFRKVDNALKKIAEYENIKNFKYDYIIKTRFDLIYNATKYEINDNQVLIDSGNVFPNDHIIMCQRNKFFKIIDFIMNEFFNPVFENSGKLAPHNLLKNSIIFNNLEIKTQKIVNCVLRVNGPQPY